MWTKNEVSMRTFVCADCKKRLLLDDLSDYSLNLARTDDPVEAVRKLEKADILCVLCDLYVYASDDVPDALWDEDEIPYCSDIRVYQKQYSGIELDRPTIDWLRQNY
jgi:hypothetical protein